MTFTRSECPSQPQTKTSKYRHSRAAPMLSVGEERSSCVIAASLNGGPLPAALNQARNCCTWLKTWPDPPLTWQTRTSATQREGLSNTFPIQYNAHRHPWVGPVATERGTGGAACVSILAGAQKTYRYPPYAAPATKMRAQSMHTRYPIWKSPRHVFHQSLHIHLGIQIPDCSPWNAIDQQTLTCTSS